MFDDPNDVEALLAAVKKHGTKWKRIGEELNKPYVACE